MNGKDCEKEAEITAGHNSYAASPAASLGPGGSTNAFSRLITPASLSLLSALRFLVTVLFSK